MKQIFALFLILPTIFAEKICSVISANNEFAADIYKELSKKEDNFLVSPFSIESVLAFVHSGARGQTAEELRTGLHLPNNQSQISTEFRNIFPNFKGKDGLYSLHSANKLYLAKNFTIKDDFRKTAVDAFHADLETVDFFKNEETAKIINRWVEEKTENKIRDLVDPRSLDSTVALVVNALYFKGNWSLSFDKSSTGKRDFYHIDKKIAPVETMYLCHEERTLGYGESQELDAKFLEMEFQGGDVSMVVVLPNDKDGIAKLEERIDEVLAFDSFQSEYVNVSLPKFKIETKIDVKQVLQSLGVKKAFTRGQADFGGISDGIFYIGQVIQKSFINVYETGVEAAASTYDDITLFFNPMPVFKEFHADHPFIYFIKVKDLIVFAGRVGAPRL